MDARREIVHFRRTFFSGTASGSFGCFEIVTELLCERDNLQLGVVHLRFSYSTAGAGEPGYDTYSQLELHLSIASIGKRSHFVERVSLYARLCGFVVLPSDVRPPVAEVDLGDVSMGVMSAMMSMYASVTGSEEDLQSVDVDAMAALALGLRDDSSVERVQLRTTR